MKRIAMMAAMLPLTFTGVFPGETRLARRHGQAI